MMSATEIGNAVGLKPRPINNILSELGWIERGKKGWLVKEMAVQLLGATQKHSYPTGVPYVLWSKKILENSVFTESIKSYTGSNVSADTPADNAPTEEQDFRKKFDPNFRATDGHYVRSKAEMLIDNFLYNAGLVHAYKRKLPIEEKVYSDFYLLNGKVFIEYWGLENDEKYKARKKKKQEIYRKYNFKLIELTDKEVQNLDDHLPRLLLQFGITVD